MFHKNLYKTNFMQNKLSYTLSWFGDFKFRTIL